MHLQNKIYNNLMLHGNKSVTEKIIKKTIKSCQKISKKNHKKIFKKAIFNLISPVKLCKLNQKNKKKIVYFAFINNKKIRISLAIKTLIKKRINSIQYNLVNEIFQILNKTSNILKENQIEQKNSVLFKKSAFFRWFF